MPASLELVTRSRHLIVLTSGQELMGSLTEFCRGHQVAAAEFSAIGVLSDARIGYLNPVSKAYDEFDVNEPAEVVTLSGSVVHNHGEPEVHAHVALGAADTSVRGGHLLSGHVHPTLEVFLPVFSTPASRAFDESTGQELIELERR